VRVKSASLKNKSKIIITEKYKYFLFFSNEISFHGCNTRFYHGKNKHGSIHRRWVKSSVPWMDGVTDTLPPATRCNTLRTIGSLSLHRHDSQATTSAWLVCTRYAHCPPAPLSLPTRLLAPPPPSFKPVAPLLSLTIHDSRVTTHKAAPSQVTPVTRTELSGSE
jgi:hypothetical protein